MWNAWKLYLETKGCKSSCETVQFIIHIGLCVCGRRQCLLEESDEYFSSTAAAIPPCTGSWPVLLSSFWMWWVRSSTSLSWGCFGILLQVSAWDLGRKAKGKEEVEDKSHGNSAGSENHWGNQMSQRAVGLEVATLTEMRNFFISRVYVAFLALTVLYLVKDFQSPLFMLWSLVFW